MWSTSIAVDLLEFVILLLTPIFEGCLLPFWLLKSFSLLVLIFFGPSSSSRTFSKSSFSSFFSVVRCGEGDFSFLGEPDSRGETSSSFSSSFVGSSSTLWFSSEASSKNSFLIWSCSNFSFDALSAFSAFFCYLASFLLSILWPGPG